MVPWTCECLETAHCQELFESIKRVLVIEGLNVRCRFEWYGMLSKWVFLIPADVLSTEMSILINAATVEDLISTSTREKERMKRINFLKQAFVTRSFTESERMEAYTEFKNISSAYNGRVNYDAGGEFLFKPAK